MSNAIEHALQDLHDTKEIVASLSRDLYDSIEGMHPNYEERKKVKRSHQKTDDVSLFIKKFGMYLNKMGPVMLGVRDNREGREGDTLLHTAARVGVLTIAAFLIEQGVDVNAVDTSQTQVTPLLKALKHSHFEVAYILAQNGANAKCRDANGCNIFHYIAKRKAAIALKEIVQYAGLTDNDVMDLASQEQASHICYGPSAAAITETESSEEKMRTERRKQWKNAGKSPAEIRSLEMEARANDGGLPFHKKAPWVGHTVHMKKERGNKSRPEDCCEPHTLVCDILVAFREQGHYISHSEQKKITAASSKRNMSRKSRKAAPSGDENNGSMEADEMNALMENSQFSRFSSEVNYSASLLSQGAASKEEDAAAGGKVTFAHGSYADESFDGDQ
jgi:hypothetical protein